LSKKPNNGAITRSNLFGVIVPPQAFFSNEVFNMCTDCGCNPKGDRDGEHHHHHHDREYPDLIELKGNDNMNDSPESYWVLGDRVTFVVTGEESNGQYSLFNEYVPTEAGTIPHIHTQEQEIFYILEGEVRFQRGNETLNATAGDLIVVPPGTPHAYQNQGTKSARMLVLTNPSQFAWFENLVRQTGQPGTDPSSPPPLNEETRERILNAFARNKAVPLNSMIFAAPEFSVNEDGTPIVAIAVVRPLNNQGTAGATITLSDGTANSPEDYNNIDIPVNFADGETIQIVNIPLTDDRLIESNETINLKLSNPTGDSAIGLLQDSAVLTIVDNDARPDAADGVPINGSDNDDILTGGQESESITGGKGNDTVNGGGGQDLFTINLSDGIDTINDFTGVGIGTNPFTEVLVDIDTLKFEGDGLIAKNMILTQSDSDLSIAFEGLENTGAIFKNFKLEDLDNLRETTGASVDIGNILFDAENAFQDSFDVFDANAEQMQVFNHNTVTFLNDLDNTVSGFDNSDDVINGQNGNDTLKGLSGNDLLRGEKNDDILVGGFGKDTLVGGDGKDTFVFARQTGIDIITDFTDTQDAIGLSNDLSFADLTITQGTGGSTGDTLINITSTNELIAILRGVTADNITSVDFTVV
jgi:quercetin dioxygenase-like cupin family protein